jgi:peptide/nickel transport system substrate-binding protein
MKRFSVILCVAVLLSLVGLGLTGAIAAEGKRGGTLVIPFASTPRHLNPAVQSGIWTMIPGSQIFATPLRYDENWKPHPYLAKSWKVSEDRLSVTLHLVEGATFHDGKPITSEDVAFSIKTVKENHPFKTMFEPVERVDVPDQHTAVIRLSKPHPAILLAMSSALCPIIPKHIFGDGQDVKTHPMNSKPVGSGPFKFVEYKPGEHIILERNENFFIKGRPYLDRIVIKVIKDINNRAIALERREVHLYPFESDVYNIRRLEKCSHLGITDKGYAGVGPINWVAFNLKRKPFDDKRVRQAIAYAIDRDFIIQQLFLGLGKPATGPIVPESPFYFGDVEKYDLDLDKANALLDEAGYPRKADGKRFSMSVDYIPNVSYQKRTAEYLKPALKKVGIDVQIRTSADFPTWAKRVSTWEFDVTGDAVFNWGDPVIGVVRTYISNNIKKGVIWSNTQSYSNPKVDHLAEEAGVEMDMARRKALYAEFQKIVADDLPIYWINVIPFHTIYDRNLRNLPLTIWGTMGPLDDLYWEKQPR